MRLAFIESNINEIALSKARDRKRYLDKMKCTQKIRGQLMRQINARQCTIEVMSDAQAQNFVHLYHRQGKISDDVRKLSLGLIYESELVGVIQFCSPRTARKKREYSTELVRLCFKEDVRIRGGASKLIKYYMLKYKPADIFTYQDTTGEVTAVYAKSGFKLIEETGKKKYLVAPNKTLETADRRAKEILSVALAAKLGPDKLLGTKIGSMLSIKTNLQLFQDLGWHLEETSGDRLYEWVNKELTFYTYKITAKDSDKYYYGVSHIKKGNATKDDCINDGYYGSGGKHIANNKFNNWKKKHSDFLLKTVLETFPRRGPAYRHEALLVGDLWKEDPKCLNSRTGGINNGNSSSFVKLSQKKCVYHGMTKHRGETCCRCTASKNISLKSCDIHGRVKFKGEHCYRCLTDKSLFDKVCNIHGLTLHRSENCLKCAVKGTTSKRTCLIHGETTFQGLSCSRCVNEKLYSIKNCSLHGRTKHRVDACMKCASLKTFTLKECSSHGLVKFIGEHCATCTNEARVTLKECPIHGLSKYLGDNCYLCQSIKNVTERECPKHGLGKFLGNKCLRCRKPGLEEGICDIHGSSFYGKKGCLKCTSKKRSLKEKVCGLCENVFVPKSTRQKVCEKLHYIPCPYCGKEMLYHSKKKTCSISCGLKYKTLTKEASDV